MQRKETNQKQTYNKLTSHTQTLLLMYIITLKEMSQINQQSTTTILQCFGHLYMYIPYIYSVNCHIFTSASSLADARSPGTLGFHVTEFTS